MGIKIHKERNNKNKNRRTKESPVFLIHNYKKTYPVKGEEKLPGKEMVLEGHKAVSYFVIKCIMKKEKFIDDVKKILLIY